MGSKKEKWRIIFYPHLHPEEPRILAEAQFTNKRIYIFTKHKRYHHYDVPYLLLHEFLHILFKKMFRNYRGFFDYTFDTIDYQITKRMNLKKVVKEKGWNYAKQMHHPWNLQKYLEVATFE